MKKLAFLTLTVTLLVAVFTLFSQQEEAVAEPQDAATAWAMQWGDLLTAEVGAIGDNSAQVAKGFLCGLVFNLTTQSHATQSNSGNETLQCKGDLPDAIPPPDQTMRFEGLLCGLIFSGLTTNSTLQVHPSGKIDLKCQT